MHASLMRCCALQAYILKLESQNAAYKAALRRTRTTVSVRMPCPSCLPFIWWFHHAQVSSIAKPFLQGGAGHVMGFQKELNGVLRQLQQRDEQLRQKDASLVRALSCSAVSISCFLQHQQSCLL